MKNIQRVWCCIFSFCWKSSSNYFKKSGLTGKDNKQRLEFLPISVSLWKSKRKNSITLKTVLYVWKSIETLIDENQPVVRKKFQENHLMFADFISQASDEKFFNRKKILGTT